MIASLANAHRWLAQDRVPYGKILAAAGLLIVAMVVAFAGVMYLRRRLNHVETKQVTGAFTLEDLRELLREGQLSQEEYERAKQQMIAQFSVGGTDEPATGDADGNLRPPEGTSSS